MHDKRLSLSVRSKVVFDLIEDRFFFAASFKRHRKQPGRLVEHDQILIFVENPQRTRFEWRRPASCAARPVFPHANLIAGLQPEPNVLVSHLCAVDEHLPSLARRRRLRPRPQSIGRRQKFIQRDPRLALLYTPRSLGHLWTLDFGLWANCYSCSGGVMRFVAVCNPCATSARMPMRT